MKALFGSRLFTSLLFLSAALIIFSTVNFAKSNEKTICTYEMNAAVSQYEAQLPQPVGGYEALMDKIEYPELAAEVKLEGEVLAKISIDSKGNVEDVKLLKTAGGGCDEAVEKAIRDTKFQYTASEGTPVIRQISVLFRFSLHNN